MTTARQPDAAPAATLAVRALGLAAFRSHARARLELDARPVAIIGPNGAGKTNLIEAVSLLVARARPARGGGRGAGAAARAGRMEGGRGGDRAGRPARGRDLVGGAGATGRDRRQAGEPDGARVGGAGALADAGDGPPLARGRFRAAAVPRPGDAEPGPRPRRGGARLRAGAARAQPADPRRGARRRLVRRRSRAQLAGFGARLSANRAAALERLAAVPGASDFPRAELALEGAGPRDEAGLRDGAAGRATRRPGGRADADRSAPGRPRGGLCGQGRGGAARSTGEQKALLVSLVLANAQAVAEGFGAPPLLLLDEVTAHLDDGRREALFAAVLATRSPSLDDRHRTRTLHRAQRPCAADPADRERRRIARGAVTRRATSTAIALGACAGLRVGHSRLGRVSRPRPEAHWRSPPRTPPPPRMIRPTPLLEFPDNRLLIDLCGELDRNIVQIESRLGVAIHRRGNHLALHGPAPEREAAEQVLRSALRPARAGAAGDAGRRRGGDPHGAGAAAGGGGAGQPARHVLGRAARRSAPGARWSSRAPRRRRPTYATCSATSWSSGSGRPAPARPISRSPRRSRCSSKAMSTRSSCRVRRSRPASGSGSCPAT